jgi:hypothetical protein
MGLLRVMLIALFGVFAVVAGLLTAAAFSLGTALVVFVRRMLRQAGPSPLPNARPPRVRHSNRSDVIDITATEVTATEVPADSAFR